MTFLSLDNATKQFLLTSFFFFKQMTKPDTSPVTEAKLTWSFWLLSSASHCRPKAREHFESGSRLVNIGSFPPATRKGFFPKAGSTQLPHPTRPERLQTLAVPHLGPQRL